MILTCHPKIKNILKFDRVRTTKRFTKDHAGTVFFLLLWIPFKRECKLETNCVLHMFSLENIFLT